MSIFTIITILVVLSSIFAYINVRFLRLPSTIGLMIMAIALTLLVLLVGIFDVRVINVAESLMRSIDLSGLILDVLLSFLLFAGALHTDWGRLKEQAAPIITFATVGVLASTFVVGTFFFWVSNHLIGYEIGYIYCLLFGALISPTDPIAVLGILKKIGVPKQLEVKFVGESLFNDGVGVVIFLTLFSIAERGIENVGAGEIGVLFAEEVLGGIALGLALGYITQKLTSTIDDYETEVMITLAIVMGGYLLASKLHFSGPLAVVVAGLFIGNSTRETAMSETTRTYLDRFWELLDVFLNAILFVLIGLELLIISYEPAYIVAGVVSILIVLLSRYAVLKLPIYFFKDKLDFVNRTDLIMTWGGLRGGISVALALSLTNAMNREYLLTVTYIVVVFSIIVQGLTVEKLIKRLGVMGSSSDNTKGVTN